jgi:hypothetical protein
MQILEAHIVGPNSTQPSIRLAISVSCTGMVFSIVVSRM